MATSWSSAMKSSLVVLLLLSAVMASQANRVSWTNTCKIPIGINGIWIAPARTISMELTNVVLAEVTDLKGVKRAGKYICLEYFKALVIVCVRGFVELRLPEISVLGSSTEVSTELFGGGFGGVPVVGGLVGGLGN